MNILNLRSVGSMEISNSFRGILRISPNDGEDNPTALLTTENKEISLSDSEGNLLPITFIPKTFSTIVIDSESTKKDLIHITQVYSNLYISKSLNHRSTLYICPSNNVVPIIFSNGTSSLGYPKEAPDNKSYFNYNNIYKFSKSLSTEENIDKISPDAAVYKDETQWVKVNNSYPQRYIQYNGKTYKVPFLKKREYTLGHIGSHQFKRSNSKNIYDLSGDIKTKDGSTHTQLSYIPLEGLSFSNIESQVGGIYRSPLKGRYFQLNSAFGEQTNTSSNLLAKTLFGENIEEENTTLINKAPIMGVPVQSGTIHYNAIPAKHYFFHLIRRYDNSNRTKHLEKSSGNTITDAFVSTPTVMNNLIQNYVLCDGKDIKTGYPNISKSEIEKKFSISETFKAIAASITQNPNANTFTTPPLFEMDQLSLRFLRGLNWLRTGEKTFSNNTKTYVKIYDNKGNPLKGDFANLKKDINEVGMYYFNSDNAIHKTYKHAHLLFAKPNGEVDGSNLDSLADEKTMFQGNLNSELPTARNEWTTYVNGDNATFKGTKMLKTVGSMISNGYTFSNDRIKKLQNYPISALGGCNSYFYAQKACIRFGKRKLGKCMNSRTRCQGPIQIRDGFYHLASGDTNATTWRLVSSLPRGTKYGKIDSFEPLYSFSKDSKNNIFNVDDSLSSPPAINLIPLMKI